MNRTGTKPKGATSYQDTAFGIIPRSKLIKFEIEGTKKGLEYLYDLFEEEKVARITPELITKLHKIAFGWIFPKWAGRYRKVQVTFSGKEALPYYQVQEMTLNLCQNLEERLKHLPKPGEENYILKIVSLLAWFQHQFVFIHPFQDYNGRTARMLTILILFILNMPAIELTANTKEDRKRYILAMQQADEGNMDLLEKLIAQALAESLDKIKK